MRGRFKPTKILSVWHNFEVMPNRKLLIVGVARPTRMGLMETFSSVGFEVYILKEAIYCHAVAAKIAKNKLFTKRS